MSARAASRPHDRTVARLVWQLASQTVALLLVMLVVLEIVVYLITQQAQLSQLETSLKARANPGPGFIASIFHMPSTQGNPPSGQQGAPSGGPGAGTGQGYGPPPGGNGGQYPGGGPHPGFGPGQNPDDIPSDVSSAFVSPSLRIVHADGALGQHLIDRSDARTVLKDHTPICCTVAQYKGQDYLIYTAPLSVGSTFVGVVQNSISEVQYEDTMRNLLEALIIVALLGIVTSAGISGVLVGRAVQPVRAAMTRQREFVADAAHELRTPLAIQRTVGEVGLGAESVDELQETVAQMLGQNQHLSRLVDDLSLLARTDTNTVSLEHAPVDLSALVQDTATELSYLAEEKGVTLESDVTPGLTMSGDVLRLRQLLLILLDNALKHTPDGGTVYVALNAAGHRAQLQVVDTGPGIDPAHLPRIFDRFYRAETSRTTEGSGLGLAIGKWIAEAHGGQITAANAPGAGAAFTVTLPLSHSPAQAPAQQVHASSPR